MASSSVGICALQMLLEFCKTRKWCRDLLGIVLVLQDKSQAHGVHHVIRVLCIAFTIAQKVNADLDVVVAASLLHDIGRGSERYGVHHSVSSTVIAEPLLLGLGFPRNKIAKVVDSIRSHSFSGGKKPSSLEACVLSDADKLDALGAIGVYRAIAFGVEIGRSLEETINHYDEKLKNLDSYLCFEFSRRIASRLMRTLREYFEALRTEAYWYSEVQRELTSIALSAITTNKIISGGSNTYTK